VIIIVIKLLAIGVGVGEVMSLAVVLLVASIPIAMQVVCTTTMAMGSQALSKENAIVSRLASIEELAGMKVLCSDKTGTITKNQFAVEDSKYFSTDETR
jgi:H+-transporting ATPase